MTDVNKKRILVVDDEINVCKSIRQALLCEAYEIDTSLSGEDALKKEDVKRYDVIVADLMMPGLSGLDLLQALKGKNSAAKVIMITGYPTLKNTVQSVQLGAFDFLPKPFLPSDLRNVVARALEAGDSEKQG